MTFLLAFGYFLTLTCFFLTKLWPIWNHAIPGGLEDTRIFLWNAWWFHHAMTNLHSNPFHTSMLFFPFGCRLISHDFPMWMNLITFLGQRAGLSLISSSNVWFGLSWVLLGFCGFGLAFEITKERGAALVAGTYVMTSSYTLARAMQNWGQFNSWSIALFLWCLVRARKKSSLWGWLLAGAALTLNAACHFYFLVYSFLIWFAVAIVDVLPYSFHVVRKLASAASGRETSFVRHALLAFSMVLGAAAIGIAFHPAAIQMAGRNVSMQSPENALFLMWILLAFWGITFFRIKATKRSFTSGDPIAHDALRNHLLLIATAIFLLSPLILASLQVMLQGEYPKQTILWKTHLSGANVLALLMPNPLNAFWGSAVSRWFAVRGLNAQEQAAQIGWVCLAVLLGSKIWLKNLQARRWLFLALAATILAMGTHLHIAQHNLWCPLPFFWLRLLPIVGNVRVPERWMAVGAIAWGVLLAIAMKKRPKAAFLVLALLLLENWPGIPMRPAPFVSSVYEKLHDLPSGAVLPIPLYIGDSSIGAGNAIENHFLFPWDHLWAQVIHEKPMLGGFVGRIPRHLIDDYKADPFIRTLLDLEEEKIQNRPAEPAFGMYSAANLRFHYVLLYPGTTRPDVVDYVRGSLAMTLLDQGDGIELYEMSQGLSK